MIIFLSPQVKEEELDLTDECQRLINYVKVIDNYFNILGSLESAMRLPHQPIEIGVAADTHRYTGDTRTLHFASTFFAVLGFSAFYWYSSPSIERPPSNST